VILKNWEFHCHFLKTRGRFIRTSLSEMDDLQNCDLRIWSPDAKFWKAGLGQMTRSLSIYSGLASEQFHITWYQSLKPFALKFQSTSSFHCNNSTLAEPHTTLCLATCLSLLHPKRTILHDYATCCACRASFMLRAKSMIDICTGPSSPSSLCSHNH